MPIGPNGEELPYPGDPGFGGGMSPGAAPITETGDPELDDALFGAEEEDPALAGGGDPLEFLRTALESVQSYIEQESDDINSSKAARVLQGLYDILANEQKAVESATGVTPAAKVVARNRPQ